MRLAIQAFVTLAVVGVFVYGATWITLSQRQDTMLVEKKAMVRHLLAKLSPDTTADELQHSLLDFLIGHAEMGMALRLPDGRVLEAGVAQRGGRAEVKSIEFPIDSSQALGQASQATLYMDTANDRDLLSRLAAFLAVAALCGVLLMSGGSYLMVQRSMLPLHGLIAQIRLLSASRLDKRLDGSLQPEELQPLIEQFNLLLERLDRAYRQLEAFSADVAHELNTPLALLVGSCQLGLQRSRSVEEFREILGANLEDLDRMAAIVRDMLFLARADQGIKASATEAVRLSVIVQEVLDFHEAALHDAGLEAVVEGDAVLAAEGGLMRRALSNLISNATRFGSRGTSVVVRIAQVEASAIEFAVENVGPEIAAQDLEKIFKRFYRGDPARSGVGGNHGLGLAIVDAIARMHGGEAFAASEGRKTIVGLRLPMSVRPSNETDLK